MKSIKTSTGCKMKKLQVSVLMHLMKTRQELLLPLIFLPHQWNKTQNYAFYFIAKYLSKTLVPRLLLKKAMNL